MTEEEYIDDGEWANTEESIIKEVKDFAKRANEHDHEFYKRIKSERAFASGEQWNDGDKTNRGENRAEMTINLCGVFIASVVNPFNARPFKFKAVPKWSQDEYVNANALMGQLDTTAYKPPMPKSLNEEVVKLNKHLTSIQNDFATNESNTQGLYDAVSTGLGFTYATVEEEEGEKRIRYNHIEDQTMVIVSPEAKGIALQEADRIAVVDFMLYTKAKDKFGEDIVKSNAPETATLTNFGSNWEVPKDNVAVITYYRKDGHNVEFFRLCGDHIVDYGVFEGLEYLPIFAFTGDRAWIGKKLSYSGIVRKIKNEQKTINYAQSQLIERLAKSPKGFFIGYSESFEGHEDSIQNAEYGTSQIIDVNAKTEGFSMPNGMPLPLPTFHDPHVIVDDLQQVINGSINQMSVATGVSPNGIVEQNLTDQKTATEVLLRTKSSQSNVSNYISHAKETIRIAGNVIAHLCILLYGIELPKGSYDIVVEEGCVSLTKMEEDREKLLALAQIVPESFKPLISQKIVKTLDIEGGEELSQQLYNMLPAELRGGQPSVQEFTALQMEGQRKDAQIQELNDQIKALNDHITQLELRTKADLLLEDKRFEHNVQMKTLEYSQGDKETAQKMLFEVKKDELNAAKELAEKAMESRVEVVKQAQ